MARVSEIKIHSKERHGIQIYYLESAHSLLYQWLNK